MVMFEMNSFKSMLEIFFKHIIHLNSIKGGGGSNGFYKYQSLRIYTILVRSKDRTFKL